MIISIVSRLWYRAKSLVYVVLEHGASWASGLLFRAHVIPAFFNYNFHEKTKEVCIKTRPTSALHSIEG